ncbi:MAG: class I SAM-dependent methyltransferase [Alicyclobacillaceae bacterium]|nr:class I SAM-dependent methyltransferase [Alicyclobacillaceae bacterium]
MTRNGQGLVTTAGRSDPALEFRAMEAARELGVPYEPRAGRSLDDLLSLREACWVLVVGREGLFLYAGGRRFPYHPGMAVGRLRQILQGGRDPLLEAAGVRPGDRVIDGTFGLGADAVILSYAAGPTGRVIGIESRPAVAYLVREGLSRYVYPTLPELEEAMRRIDVVCADHLEYLRSLPDRSVDLVYFDPMFRKTVQQARSMDALRELGDPRPLSPEAVAEARRVARRRVVMKERRESEEFFRLGFTPLRKGSGRIQFGVIEVGG